MKVVGCTGGREQGSGDKLSRVLQEWRGQESQAGFEQAVWRRIQTAPARDFEPTPVLDLLSNWLFPRTAWTSALAMVLGVVIGVWAGMQAPAERAATGSTEPLLHLNSLSGAYLAMAAGDAP